MTDTVQTKEEENYRNEEKRPETCLSYMNCVENKIKRDHSEKKGSDDGGEVRRRRFSV